MTPDPPTTTVSRSDANLLTQPMRWNKFLGMLCLEQQTWMNLKMCRPTRPIIPGQSFLISGQLQNGIVCIYYYFIMSYTYYYFIVITMKKLCCDHLLKLIPKSWIWVGCFNLHIKLLCFGGIILNGTCRTLSLSSRQLTHFVLEYFDILILWYLRSLPNNKKNHIYAYHTHTLLKTIFSYLRCASLHRLIRSFCFWSSNITPRGNFCCWRLLMFW